jgi:hypothetical protein
MDAVAVALQGRLAPIAQKRDVGLVTSSGEKTGQVIEPAVRALDEIAAHRTALAEENELHAARPR